MRYITLNSENKVTSIRMGPSIVEGELQSDIGEIGQIMQSDGTFTEDTTPAPNPGPTLEDRVSAMEDALMLMI